MSQLFESSPNQRFLVFDFETEGLSEFFARPWQIAYLIAENDKIVERFNAYIYWKDLNISKGAAMVTNFRREQYDVKADVRESRSIFDRFEKELYNPKNTIVGHNILGYDCYIHNTWRRHYGLPSDYSYLPRLIDTNPVAKAIKLGIKMRPEEDRLAFQYKLMHFRKKGLKSSLTYLCKEYGIEVNEVLAHDAHYDIEQNFKIFNIQRKLMAI